MRPAWWSYDSAAATHDRLAVPYIFRRPAEDLAAAVGPTAGGVALDVGTGTGVAALQAVKHAGPEAVIVGIDPSLEMLAAARNKGLRLAVASAPGLPFPGEVFDTVMASFVVAHFADYRSSLADMARVLRPGGRLGGTAWGPTEDAPRRVWQEAAESHADKEALERAIREALPWEEWFSKASRLGDALREAGLGGIDLRRREYKTAMRISEFLAIRETSLTGRFLRHTLGPEKWEAFRHNVAEQFHARFLDPVEHTRDAYIAVGTKA